MRAMVNDAKYEEIQVGDTACFSKTVSEADVYGFAGISGDFNPIHVDAEFAKGNAFRPEDSTRDTVCEFCLHGAGYCFAGEEFGLFVAGGKVFGACFYRGYADGASEGDREKGFQEDPDA
jgi:acyl dehydratase